MTQSANDQRIPNDQCRIFFNNTRLRWRVTRAAQPPPAWFSSTRDLVLGANWSLGILVIHWSLRHWSLVICSEREPTGNVEEPVFFARSRCPANLFDRPAGVFGDERLGIGGGPFQRRQGAFLAAVSQGNTHVAEQPAAFGAVYRSVSKLAFEPGLIEGQQFQKAGLSQVAPRVRFH